MFKNLMVAGKDSTFYVWRHIKPTEGRLVSFVLPSLQKKDIAL